MVVDDDLDLARLVAARLEEDGYTVDIRTSGSQALQRLDGVDVILTDVVMDDVDGITLCREILTIDADLPVIVMTASSKIETAISAIRAGAYDFVTKPLDLEALSIVVERATAHRDLRVEVATLRRAVRGRDGYDEILGESAAMQRLYAVIDQFAPSEASVLITGESGTGKELVARALHAKGVRRGTLVAVNCAAMPEGLLESELFGHERGAFTDARAGRRGLFVQASGGTLFLDEVGELPLGLQAKLLRALEERRVRPVGATEEVAFDARIIAATNRDLESAIENKLFREDLYYRLNVLRVDLPPLRARGRDILLLAHHFLERFALQAHKPVSGLGHEVAAKLLDYRWPGNVRELRNSMERAVAVASDTELGMGDLPEAVREYRPRQFALPGDSPEELLRMEEVERRYVVRVLEVVQGNKRRAAQILGFDRRTLYRKLERWGIGSSE